MALIDIGGYIAIPSIMWAASSTPVANNRLINASGEKVGFMFRVVKTGTLHKVGFRTGAVSTVQDLKVSFQNVSGFLPDGTIDEFRVITPVANSWHLTGILSSDGTDGGTKRSVTAGDLLAVVIEFDSTVGSVNITGNNPDAGVPFMFAHLAHFTASWAGIANVPNIYVEYSDGSTAQHPGVDVFSTLIQDSYDSGTTPDERALRFQVPYPCRVMGAWMWADTDGAHDIVLYEDTTAKLTISQVATTDIGRLHIYAFPAGQVITKDTEYFLSMKPTSLTNCILYSRTVDEVKYLDALSGGQAFHLGTRTDAGAWSKTTTTRPMMGILIDQVDDGDGGGGESSHVF